MALTRYFHFQKHITRYRDVHIDIYSVKKSENDLNIKHFHIILLLYSLKTLIKNFNDIKEICSIIYQGSINTTKQEIKTYSSFLIMCHSTTGYLYTQNQDLVEICQNINCSNQNG